MMNIIKEFLSVKGVKWRSIFSLIIGLSISMISARMIIWISNIISNTDKKEIMMMYFWLFIFGNTFITVFGFVKSILMRRSYDRVFCEILQKICDKILTTDYNTFTKYGNGYIDSVTGAAGEISSLGRYIIRIFTAATEFIVIWITIFTMNAVMGIICIPIYGISFIILRHTWKKLAEAKDKLNQEMRKRSVEIENIINGFEEVRCYGMEKQHSKSIRSMNTNTFNLRVQTNRYSTMSDFWIDMIDNIVTLVGVLIAMVLIPQGVITSTYAITILMVVWRMLNPFLSLSDVVDGMTEALSKYKLYDEFMKIEDKITDGDIELSSFDSSISLKDVSFGYEKSDTVLNKVSLIVKKGEKVGICGHSGGGKTTLIKLLLRLYDVNSGSISIDGIDIRDLTLESLRSHIGVVGQDCYILNGTILENVKYGSPDAKESEIIEACKKASIYDFIKSQKDGFDTNVGPSGVKLSGGQKQRISLARVFLRNPDIILLDEATSALDNESEKVIQESLKLFDDKTIITIAHRLSTIKDCDTIYVIDNHQIAEKGNHESLLMKKGIYNHLYQLSLKEEV